MEALSPLSPLLQQATRVLEWERMVSFVATHARSSLGALRCRSLPLECELEMARLRLQETEEMLAAQASTTPFPSLQFPDVREAIGRAAKGAALELSDLRDIAAVLELVVEVARHVSTHRMSRPCLYDLAQGLAEEGALMGLARALDRCIDRDGQIRESATPELRALSRQVHDLKQHMRHRLETILGSERYAEVLQERYFDQREGRYVVPVKTEMQSKVPGIVHDVSASGATVFLEPRELVELNNSIKVAELELQREVRRILHDLSQAVAREAPGLTVAVDSLATLDCVAAKASFSRLMQGTPVALNADGRIALKQARHPLLMVAKTQVVPNDVQLDESVRVLVISGPNTGGKTVTMKIIGLFALMVRAGLLLPCAPGSEMGFFPRVYADIGDAQDLAKDLSSFSAHMTQMIELLKETSGTVTSVDGLEGVTAQPEQVLVLLDEPVTSTDPLEGAALAEALLVHLARLGLKVVVTTHYNALKALAQMQPGFVNASVEFDVSRLAPTYRLLMNLPGGSSAIDIAGRLGMPPEILDHAQGLMTREDHAIERLLEDLHAKQRRLDEDLARAQTSRAEAEEAARTAQALTATLQASEREERKGIKRKLTDELLRARAEVQAVVDGVKRERTLSKAKEAKEQLAQIDVHARTAMHTEQPAVPLDALSPGARVDVVTLGTSGVLLEPVEGKKRVRVRVGAQEMSIAVSLLSAAAEEAMSATAPSAGRRGVREVFSHASIGDTSVVLDLRGQMADEAVERTVAALDRAALEGTALLRIIHGHGTGRLKIAVRDHLKSSPYVASFRPGDRAEGGDGVTIVALR